MTEVNTPIGGDAQHCNWENLPLETLKGGLSRRLITGTNLMLGQVSFVKGAVVPVHAHHNEQITYVLEGALKFQLGEFQERELVVRAGEVLVIPPNLPHGAVALEDTVEVDIFNPPRADWLDGSDDYLRDDESK